MIYIIGAGPGAEDLITVRGQNLLKRADMVIYAGSLVNVELLKQCPAGCELLDSARMTLDEVIAALERADGEDKVIVRLHSGDPSIYGAIREQMDELDARGMAYEVVPGVSSLNAAAAALRAEYTLPGVSQTVIVTRMAGRTSVPERESVRSLAAHGATMVLFLSTGMLSELCAELMAGGYAADTPAALVYHASWPDEAVVRGTLATLPELARGYTRTALVLVGGFMGDEYLKSRLYAPDYSHCYREARK
ncbi:MAG TPA: precorrin-4 C(11)-methyltransferase [Candidatus Fimadaptatus faecigallinarum]|uniref:Precorrin-4 C(11)-methyltransferase n=1 Tax=Candidatus Fimadaptatus faecigallinarum TaxID=2840814 RepID=A0A9D1LPF7_9FIRM|nr:precorrin-4 C(11)-methyltransferase [Candidatus Fimadaptatus faecigallinarum]